MTDLITFRTFRCKRFARELAADQEVVTRHRTRICKSCWGALVHEWRRAIKSDRK